MLGSCITRCAAYFRLGDCVEKMERLVWSGWRVLDKLRWIGVDFRSLYMVETWVEFVFPSREAAIGMESARPSRS
jgi:hypothetical protein